MLAELNQSVVAMLASHNEQLASLREDNRTLAELNQSVVAMLASHNEQLAEMREDNRMTHNLWVNLAKRYGWLQDEDSQN